MKKIINFNKVILTIIDMILIVFSYLMSFYLTFNGKISPSYFELCIKTSFFVVLVYMVLFVFFGLYKSLWDLASIDEYIGSVCVCLIANLIINIAMMLMKLDIQYQPDFYLEL